MTKQTMTRNSLNEDVSKGNGKNVKPVIKGTAIKKKKGLGKKIADVFLEDNNGRDVKEYVLLDVVIPGIKNAIYAGITGTLDMMLFGERDIKNVFNESSRRNNSYTSYSSVNNNTHRSSTSNTTRRNRMGSVEVDDIIIPTKWEAEDVLRHMNLILEEYGMVSVADYYTLVNKPHTPIDNNWGWDYLNNAYIQRLRGDGYRIVLPRVVSLK